MQKRLQAAALQKGRARGVGVLECGGFETAVFLMSGRALGRGGGHIRRNVSRLCFLLPQESFSGPLVGGAGFDGAGIG